MWGGRPRPRRTPRSGSSRKAEAGPTRASAAGRGPAPYGAVRSGRCSGPYLNREDGLVVEGGGGELVLVAKNRAHHFGGRTGAVGAQNLRQAALAILVAGGVQIIGDAVGVEHHGVAGHGMEHHFLILALVEQTERNTLDAQIQDVASAADHGW